MRRLYLFPFALFVVSCGGDDAPPAGEYPERLSEWGLFAGSGATQEPAPGVVPYDVVSPLFSDHATKHRFIALPEGTTMTWSDHDPWGMPVGAIVIKTFGFLRDARDPSLGERLIETRLLVREDDGWSAHTYVWNEAQTEARRVVAGQRVDVETILADGSPLAFTYRVPNTNQCASCHAGEGDMNLLGPVTRQMDRDNDYGAGAINQIDHFASLGMFDVTPPARELRDRLVDPWGDAPLETRARSYLDANCAHCHREGGNAYESGLWLGWQITDPYEFGVCRNPVAAGGGTGGRGWDIVPGDPDASIMIFRMESTDPEIKMPELPSVLADMTGASLIREWIASMAPVDCSAPAP